MVNAFSNFGDLVSRDRDLNKTAIIELGREKEVRRFSYADIDILAMAVASKLLSNGLHRGDRVAIVAQNCAEYLCVYYGILRAGLVAVPINIKLSPQLIEFVIRDSGAKFIFSDLIHGNLCPKGVPIAYIDEEELGRFVEICPFQSIIPEPNEPAMFLYTSGSTGRAKGVILSHQSLIFVTNARVGNVDRSRHRNLLATPLFHRAGLMAAAQACAAHSTIILLKSFNTLDYIDAIARYSCTSITIVPAMAAFILDEKEILREVDTSCVEMIRITAAPVSYHLIEKLQHIFQNAKIINAYATTEIGGLIFDALPSSVSPPYQSVGCRHPAVQIRLVDGDNLEASQGVLEVKTPAVMLGYHNRPEIPLPITADGYYVTNDIFRRDQEGFYYFVGRSDDMFVCGGTNVYPRDIEIVFERYPGIDQACVVPINDDIMGQKAVAFLVVQPDLNIDIIKVRHFLFKNLSSYQLPRYIWIEKCFPLTVGNKLDRATLQSIAVSRAAGE